MMPVVDSNAVDAALEQIKALQVQIKALEQAIDYHRDVVIDYVNAHGAYNNGVAKAAMSQPYTVVSYDKVRVETVLAMLTTAFQLTGDTALQEIRDTLLSARSESTREASCRITFNK